MMLKSDIANLREAARRCRCDANAATSETLKAELLKLAEEIEAKIAAAEATAGGLAPALDVVRRPVPPRSHIWFG